MKIMGSQGANYFSEARLANRCLVRLRMFLMIFLMDVNATFYAHWQPRCGLFDQKGKVAPITKFIQAINMVTYHSRMCSVSAAFLLKVGNLLYVFWVEYL